MSSLYSFTARKIALDGLRRQPALKTLSDAMALTKATEDELLKTSSVRPIKQAFPGVAKVAAAELERQTAGAGDKLTPEVRAGYVDFLNRLALGFDQARPQ